MTLDIYETSVESSVPIELYTFVLGSDTWRYCSCADPITIGADTWAPTAIKNDGISATRDNPDELVEIQMSGELELPAKWKSSVPGERATCTIQRTQDLDTTPGPREIVTLFEGAIESVAFVDGGRVASLAVRALTAAFSRIVPRQTYSGVCNHVLYSPRCGVAKASFDLPAANVDAISGRVITVAGADGQADGYWEGGYVEPVGGGDKRYVMKHVGEELTLLFPFAGVAVNDSVNVYAGCKHDTTDCATKFSNLVNFGGFPFVPLKNVFETGV